MNVLWNKKVEVENLWIPQCFGLFIKLNKTVSFFFQNNSKLLSLSEEDVNPQVIHSESSIPLPYDWRAVETAEDSFLLFSEDFGLNLKNNELCHKISPQLQAEYKHQKRPANYYVDAPKYLGEYTILHKGNWGYICMKDHSKLWEFTGRAYLYTDMIRWNDRLFFGTGGQGGYFYVLDIQTGVPLTAIKTGGTQCIIHADNHCYVLSNEKKGQLLCIDLLDGRIVSKCDLPGTADLKSRITRIDNHIHAITFNGPRSQPKSMTWSCIEI